MAVAAGRVTDPLPRICRSARGLLSPWRAEIVASFAAWIDSKELPFRSSIPESPIPGRENARGTRGRHEFPADDERRYPRRNQDDSGGHFVALTRAY